MLNKQGPGKIDWTDYTWNPISGCKHGCPYCYMLRMEKRFPGVMLPAFHPKRLNDLEKIKKPSKVFVGSSGDMWGEWVKHDWICLVMDAIRQHPQHTFQFLTKNPRRYLNALGGNPKVNEWYGTTCDGTNRTKYNIEELHHLGADNLFISFEPLIELPDWFPMDRIKWIIIGADSNRGAEKPPPKWVDTLIEKARSNNVAVWVKDNYGYPERIKEFPETPANRTKLDNS